MSTNNYQRRRIGRNIRPPCTTCSPRLTNNNLLMPSDSFPSSEAPVNTTLNHLSAFFSDPASPPSTTQSPAASPTNFAALFQSPASNTTGFTSQIFFKTPNSDPYVFDLGSTGNGSSSTNSLQVTFGGGNSLFSWESPGFDSGDTLYLELPFSIVGCEPSSFFMTMTGLGPQGGVSPCVNIISTDLLISVLTPGSEVRVFAVFPNVVPTKPFCNSLFFSGTIIP